MTLHRMHRMHRMRRAVTGVLVLVVVGVAGCTQEPTPAPVVPTIPPPTTTPAPRTTVPVPAVPATCAQLVPGDQLDTVLGVPVSMTVRAVRGQPLPDIGRTGRLTCQYGAPNPQGTYPAEISLTTYSTPAQAADRVTVTVRSGERSGIGSARVPAGGSDGLYIPFPTGGLVVASAGVFSVAVTLAPNLLPPPQIGPKAAAVAGVVLARAGV